MRCYARGRDGGWYEAASRPFLVYQPALRDLPAILRPIRLCVERVLDASPLDQFAGVNAIPYGHFALIVGWALDVSRGTGPAGVVAIDDLGRMWSAPVDVPRPDLRPILSAGDERLGFEMHVPSDVLGRGRWGVRIRGLGEDGRLFESGADATIDVAGPLRRFPFTARETDAPPRFSASIAQRNGPTSFAERALEGEPTIQVSRGANFVVEGWALATNGDNLV